MPEGSLNPQYGNMGDLGDILKHGALVELAAMMSSPGARPVAYVETHAFVLRAPMASGDRWRQEVTGSAGLLVSGRDIWITENRFKKLEIGILLLVEDPDFGSAINTALDDNRFEDLAVNVLTGLVSLNAATARTLRIWPKLPLH